MSTTTTKEAESLSYFELKALLETKKTEELDKVKKELTAAEGIVASLKAQLANLGEPVAEPLKRGRPSKNEFNPASNGKATKKKGGKTRDRGSKAKVLEFLSSKGKAGAHVTEIVAATKKSKGQISAFLATTGKKAGIKGTGKRGFYSYSEK